MNSKAILVVSHICPYPQRTGVRVRIAQTLEWLREQGFQVTYVLQPIDVESSENLRTLKSSVARLVIVQQESLSKRLKQKARILAGRMLSVVAPKLYDRVRSKPVSASMESGPQYGDIEAVCWPATVQTTKKLCQQLKPKFVLSQLAIFAKCLEGLPEGTVSILDTHELYSQNHDQFDSVKLQNGFRCTEENEKNALAKADVLIAIQRSDQATLQKWFPRKQILLMPCTVKTSVSEKSATKLPRKANTILYVGSGHHFNVHGLKSFLNSVWPALLKAEPSLYLHIVGNHTAIPFGERVQFLGRISDQQLLEEYLTASVVINPQLAGTGLKIKCVEALGLGCPLVTYEAGAMGMEDGHGKALLMAKTPSEFTEHILRIVRDARLQGALSQGALEYAEAHFSVQAAFRDLRSVLFTSLSKAA